MRDKNTILDDLSENGSMQKMAACSAHVQWGGTALILFHAIDCILRRAKTLECKMRASQAANRGYEASQDRDEENAES